MPALPVSPPAPKMTSTPSPIRCCATPTPKATSANSPGHDSPVVASAVSFSDDECPLAASTLAEPLSFAVAEVATVDDTPFPPVVTLPAEDLTTDLYPPVEALATVDAINVG